MNQIFLIGGLFFLSIGLVVFYHQIQALRWGKRSTRWPTTAGAIDSTSVQNLMSAGDITYRLKIGYRYTVNGVQYHSKRLEFGIQPDFWRKEEAAEAVSKYPIGSSVTVYYNPDNPKVAVLTTGVSSSSRIFGWFSCLVPVFLGALSIGIYLMEL
ncbi:MAG: DUF3592 domain-containing protein [Chloroflexi bacterium]|nr:DUF3592 domain-containing protein [Chloroflexota bacterium]